MAVHCTGGGSAGALRRDGAVRRTYGVGLDQIVRLESDLDGDRTLVQSSTPVSDHKGNLAPVTDSTTDQVIECYELSPYGQRTILVDGTPPAVKQIRVKDGTLWLEVSEGVHAGALQDALDAGDVTLTESATSTDVGFTVTQPVQETGQAFRRIVLTPDTEPADGTAVELRVESAALVDAFGNQLAGSYVQGFDWPAGDQVVHDNAAPAVEPLAAGAATHTVAITLTDLAGTTRPPSRHLTSRASIQA